MDKCGRLGDKLAFGIFFLALLIIGGFIVIGVYFHYGGEYEFRGIEAEILAAEIESCILEKDVDWNQLYNECAINKEVINKYGFILIQENGNDVFSVNKGETVACESQALQRNKGYLRCASSDFTKAGREYHILTGSNQRIRRIQK